MMPHWLRLMLLLKLLLKLLLERHRLLKQLLMLRRLPHCLHLLHSRLLLLLLRRQMKRLRP
jgi:hypothetical protein